MALDLQGRMVAEARCDLPASAMFVDGSRVEQEPQAWKDAVSAALRELTQRLATNSRIVGIAVDATSGTFLLADREFRPLTRGLMYNDQRAIDMASNVANSLRIDLAPYGITIGSAFALPKIVHVAHHQPELIARCHHIIHQTDWIVGMLCGRYDITDISTALKTGADPGKLAWPVAIQELGIDLQLLPKIVLPGTPIGQVTRTAAIETGVAAGTPVVAGCTDGTAGCLASGASQAGDLNTTLGTTLVFKAIADRPLLDPDGVIYNHRHPAGSFLPGAASSTGGDWIEQFFPHADLTALGRAALRHLPTGRNVYPLVKTGERFPFACPTAKGFGLAEIEEDALRFAAGMEAVAFLERLGIQRLADLGLTVGPVVFATGGAVAGESWSKIRATVNRRSYRLPQQPECAVGAAILAAMPHLGSCHAAVNALVRSGQCVDPDERLADLYDEQYGRFVAGLRERGYL